MSKATPWDRTLSDESVEYMVNNKSLNASASNICFSTRKLELRILMKNTIINCLCEFLKMKHILVVYTGLSRDIIHSRSFRVNHRKKFQIRLICNCYENEQ